MAESLEPIRAWASTLPPPPQPKPNRFLLFNMWRGAKSCFFFPASLSPSAFSVCFILLAPSLKASKSRRRCYLLYSWQQRGQLLCIPTETLQLLSEPTNKTELQFPPLPSLRGFDVEPKLRLGALCGLIWNQLDSPSVLQTSLKCSTVEAVPLPPEWK